jgi:hypothetical protein
MLFFYYKPFMVAVNGVLVVCKLVDKIHGCISQQQQQGEPGNKNIFCDFYVHRNKSMNNQRKKALYHQRCRSHLLSMFMRVLMFRFPGILLFGYFVVFHVQQTLFTATGFFQGKCVGSGDHIFLFVKLRIF